MPKAKLLNALLEAKSYIIEHCEVPGENAVVLSELQEVINVIESQRGDVVLHL